MFFRTQGVGGMADAFDRCLAFHYLHYSWLDYLYWKTKLEK